MSEHESPAEIPDQEMYTVWVWKQTSQAWDFHE
jgi:hypothetical protein